MTTKHHVAVLPGISMNGILLSGPPPPEIRISPDSIKRNRVPGAGPLRWNARQQRHMGMGKRDPGWLQTRHIQYTLQIPEQHIVATIWDPDKMLPVLSQSRSL